MTDDFERRQLALDYALKMPGDPITEAERVLAWLWPAEAAAAPEERRARGPNGAKWTPERKAYLAKAYPAGVRNSEMLACVNALPGAIATRKQINSFVVSAKLHRPPSHQTPGTIAASAAKRAAANGTAGH